MSYQIFTDATADFDRAVLDGLPAVKIIPMRLEMDGQTYLYGPGGTISVADFYARQRGGSYASTSQITPHDYFRQFEPVLRAGYDILYLCFSSGMSGTFQTAKLCARELQAQYPERKILCLDTRCASVGEGLLVWEAARRQKEGYSLERLSQWVMAHRLEVCHWFTVDVFDHLRRGGRVSAATAIFGTALQIKPLLHIDEAGKLAVLDKPRGRRQAIQAQMVRMEESWMPLPGKRVLIGHGDCPEGARMLEDAVRRRYPDAEIRVAPIGPIIGAHTGPGMLAVAHWGSIR